MNSTARNGIKSISMVSEQFSNHFKHILSILVAAYKPLLKTIFADGKVNVQDDEDAGRTLLHTFARKSNYQSFCL